MTSKSAQSVLMAAGVVPDGLPFSQEIRDVLYRAFAEAREDEDYWQEQGKPHLRTFLKTTPLGLAIRDLARAILVAHGDQNE